MTTYEKYLQLQYLSYDTNYHAIMLVYCGPYILGLSEYCELDHSRQQAAFHTGSQGDIPVNKSQLTVQNLFIYLFIYSSRSEIYLIRSQ